MPQAANSPVAERMLVITRILNAPRNLVYKAWTDPAQLAQWWGPTGFTNPLCELELKPFGEIRIDMRAPDGTVYPMSGAFREIVEPERLVFTTAALDENGKPIFENLNTITFQDFEDGKTVLTVDVRVLWESLGAERYLDGMSMGWALTLDRLDRFVAPDVSDRELRTRRRFHAPRELVYRMWTEAAHIAQWWGPRGFTTTIEHMDVRPGGEWRFVLHGPDGTNYPNHKVYEEVVPQERLVMNHVCWPKHRMAITFIAVGQETEVSIRMLFESAEDFKKVMTEHSAKKGLAENLDKLEEHLASL